MANRSIEEQRKILFPLVKRYADNHQMPADFKLDMSDSDIQEWQHHISNFISWVEKGADGDCIAELNITEIAQEFVDLYFEYREEKRKTRNSE